MLYHSLATHNLDKMIEIVGFPQAWSETFLRENNEMGMMFTQLDQFWEENIQTLKILKWLFTCTHLLESLHVVYILVGFKELSNPTALFFQ